MTRAKIMRPKEEFSLTVVALINSREPWEITINEKAYMHTFSETDTCMFFITNSFWPDENYWIFFICLKFI